MNFLDNMKLGRKMIGGFLIVVLILAIVAGYGYMTASSAATQSQDMYDNHLIPISQLGDVSADFQQVRAEIYRYIYVPDSRSGLDITIPGLFENIETNMNKFRDKDLSAAEKAELSRFDTAYAEFKRLYMQTIADAKANNMAAVDTALAAGSPLINARTTAVDSYKKLIVMNEEEAAAGAQEMADAASLATILLVVLTIVAIAIAVGIGIILTRNIAGPVNMLRDNIKEIHLGHLGNRLNLSRKDEVGEAAMALDKFLDDFQKYVIGTMKMVSEGDLSRNLKARDDKDEIVPAIQTTIETLRAMNEEANKLSRAAVEGHLKVRGNADQFKGAYWEIIAGINKTLDNVVMPLNEGMRVSEEYAAGNFTARFNEEIKVHGDFKKFRESLDKVGVQVSKAIRGINQQVMDLASSAEETNASIEEVAAGAGQVAKNASEVSVNAEKAMLGIEQVQKAMEDLSRTIQEVATRADSTAKLVQDTTLYNREGMDRAKKTELGMQGITKSSNDVNQIILEIKGQMDKISEIVNLITDLANQTNLLALNAAIEAARAGDAGRGFAVVATEVKSLAVESRASAEKIAEMINNLQNQTNHAVNAVSAANSGVKEGSDALHETLASFNKIVSAIDQISKNISEVAAASEEQAASVEEVTASVSEVNGLMQNTVKESTDAAAASEESSAAIDQITKVVANVNNIVDQVTKEITRFRV
jgi:methyl-accepting chemotaxis protein